MPNVSVGGKYYKNEGNVDVLNLIPEGVGTVLDVGCGAGDNAKALKAGGVDVDGITLSENEADSAKKYCRNVFIYNLEQGLPSGLAESYDVVMASHVLEHICFPEKLLSDAAIKIEKGGVLIVALPNLMNWRYRWRIFCGSFEYEETGIMDNTHFRWYTFVSARKLLEKNGYRVLKSYVSGHFPLSALRGILPKKITDHLDRFVSHIFPGLFGVQLLYLAKRK